MEKHLMFMKQMTQYCENDIISFNYYQNSSPSFVTANIDHKICTKI
jgi:hypothetical protein